MPKVFNWQINREMEYPYEASLPQRQFSAVFDLNKCIACQTCTFACKNAWTSGRGQEYMFWNNVESKPYGFYPLGWDVKLLDMLGAQEWAANTYQGKTVFEAAPTGRVALGFLPEDEDWAYPNLGEDESSGLAERGEFITGVHRIWNFYLPRICNHCSYPACLASCPRKAIYKRQEDGIVLIDQARCRGYRECVRACPYKKSLYNTATRITEKCIACYPQVEQGRQTQCVINCIGRIRLNGWIHTPDKSDPQNPMDYLVHERKLALPLYPQYGLQMNIYYIPPVHVPPRFLHQMFGPQVERAIQTYRSAKDDPELLGCMLLSGSTDQWIEKFKVAGGYAYGYDRGGSEVVKVPLKEPIFIRPFYDAAQDVYRHTIT
ncbi:MAG: dehydrogenase [Chloroflexota bacterium]|nr:dehydrogenase [Chloroflexota bacterium]